MNFAGFDGVANAMMLIGGASVVSGALLYSPVSGLNYGPYISGALISTLSMVVGVGAVFAAQSMNKY